MSKRQKQIDKIKANPRKVKFGQLELLLFSFEFVRVDSRGSHKAYRHRDGRTVVVVRPHGGRKECSMSDVIKVIKVLGL